MSTVHPLLSAPLRLWDLYVEHLWRYEAASWVAWIARCFRVLALATIAPFAVLTMLDVASYVIARTLGVVDVTKASTGGVAAAVPASGAGAGSGAPPADENGPLAPLETQLPDAASPASSSSVSVSTPAYFRETVVDSSDADADSGAMRLSGAGAFSPLPSQPPSPLLARRDLAAGLQMTSVAGGGETMLVDRNSGSEGEGEADGVQMRRRKAAAGDGAES